MQIPIQDQIGPEYLTKPIRSGRVDVLDGLRGVAIISVLIVHLETFLTPWASLIPRAVLVVTRNLWIGVDLFFVLSGFLITGILLKTSGLPMKDAMASFYMRRVLRICPLYYFALAISFYVIPIGIEHRFDSSSGAMRERLSYLTFVSNWLQSWRGVPLGGVMTVAWSLAIEEQFYLVWPWVARAVSVRSLKRICTVILVTSPLIRIVAWQFNINMEAIYVFTPFRLDGLAAGAWLAIFMFQTRDFSPGRLRLGKAIFLSTAILYTIFIYLTLRFPVRGTSFNFMGYFRYHPLIYTLGFSVTALCFSALIFTVLNANGPVKAFFSNKVLTTAGKFSFSIYLFHVIIGNYATSLFIKQNLFDLGAGWLSLSLYLAMFTVFIIVCAGFTWHILEEPVLRLKNYFAYCRPMLIAKTEA